MNLYLKDINIKDYDNSFVLIKDDHAYCYDKDRIFIKESNDSCNLFNGECNPPKIGNEDVFYGIKVIPFITHFNTGVHAYSGIYSILNEFIKLGSSVDEYKIVVYNNLQKGILDVLYHFFDKERIIELNANTVYKFLEIKLIPNSLHSFLENKSLTNEISTLIMDKIKINNYKNYPKKIAIIKTVNSSVTSTMGVIDNNIAKEYCENNGFLMVEPSELGEVLLANYINNCEEIIFSWGTTFIKNFIYLSERAFKSKILVFGNEFNYEYNNALSRNIIVDKYKNCIFEYMINELR
jgi:hypothetical protein